MFLLVSLLLCNIVCFYSWITLFSVPVLPFCPLLPVCQCACNRCGHVHNPAWSSVCLYMNVCVWNSPRVPSSRALSFFFFFFFFFFFLLFLLFFLFFFFSFSFSFFLTFFWSRAAICFDLLWSVARWFFCLTMTCIFYIFFVVF